MNFPCSDEKVSFLAIIYLYFVIETNLFNERLIFGVGTTNSNALIKLVGFVYEHKIHMYIFRRKNDWSQVKHVTHQIKNGKASYRRIIFNPYF